ncbi:uncharacterized protein ColSpa_06465 [Colletotrichum spaethianum]|uniref:Uncharacterized protein n=1 Tax=Colletotrichum spaethianum TaxID=700344 RepID=A0AA37LF54_9PEZI|nr:uncharacterized protein ColSpa_06465 [Colletotrichum spaethianum]GKT46284.1 hypothetical protein ColSpa_06465 [Colletotrichum spaethianum]
MIPGRMILGILLGVNNKIFNVQWSHDKGIPEQHVNYTLITLMIGDDNGASGNQPAIELFDDKGNALGTRATRSHDTVSKNNYLDDHIYKIQHDLHQNPMETPKYAVIYQWSSDAICVSAMQFSNGKFSAVFYGDIGAFCGQSWFFSRRRLSAQQPHPKCVWLDADHTVGFNARTMSFHLNDMLGTPDKVKMYQENGDYLCKSTPRFAYWRNLWQNSQVPVFRPPLEYEIDAITGLEGRDKDPKLAIDTINWDKMAYTDPQPIPEAKPKRSLSSAERNIQRAKVSKRSGTNMDISRLIVTRAEGHEASLVCNSTSSYGYDVVSLREKTYCDMTVKRLYNLCGDIYKNNCFDVERIVLVGHGGINARGEVSAIGVPQKRYETADLWEE